MRKIILVLSFVIMIACAKDPVKPSCDAANQQIEQLEKQMTSYTDQYASGLITLDQYLKEMDRLITAADVYHKQLKDCE